MKKMFLVLLVALCEASFGGGFQVADELVENCKDENGCLELKGDEKTKCEQKCKESAIQYKPNIDFNFEIDKVNSNSDGKARGRQF